jgi:hypothetical protein
LSPAPFGPVGHGFGFPAAGCGVSSFMAMGFAVSAFGSKAETGDQNGLLAAAFAPFALEARLPVVADVARADAGAGAGSEGCDAGEERPNRGGRVTVESFKGVISAAKSSGHS